MSHIVNELAWNSKFEQLSERFEEKEAAALATLFIMGESFCELCGSTEIDVNCNNGGCDEVKQNNTM